MNALSTAQAHWGMHSPLPFTAGSNMPPSKADLDRDLGEFLKREEEAERSGFTKKALHSAMGSLDGRFADHEKKDDIRHADIVGLYRGLEARMHSIEGEHKALKSDFSELKPAVREVNESLHDITEQALEAKLVESTDKHKKLVAVIWQIAIYVICAGAGVAVTYFAFRLGLTPPH